MIVPVRRSWPCLSPCLPLKRFSLTLNSLQGTCHCLRDARFSSEPLDKKGVEAVSVAGCLYLSRTDRKGYSAYVETAFRKTFSTWRTIAHPCPAGREAHVRRLFTGATGTCASCCRHSEG